MRKLIHIKSVAAVINIENIDTDQIIGSDHLKITNKQGLGKYLFSDWRYMANGEDDTEFVLNKEITCQSKILIVGDNFGCGSSREHAPWALLEFGFDVVISSSIADIFFNNSIKNGLIPIQVMESQHEFLLEQNGKKIEVDLDAMEIKCEGRIISFELESFARYCLMNGVDQLSFLQEYSADITNYEKKRTQGGIQ